MLQGKNRGLERRWVEGRVTVSKGCHNKVPEAGWLKATETSFSHSGDQTSEVKVLAQPCFLMFSGGGTVQASLPPLLMAGNLLPSLPVGIFTWPSL